MPARLLRPGSRAVRLSSVGAVVVALLSAAAIVWSASYSALSATTSNASNSWATGSVVLADDDAGAMFSVTNLKPGSSGSKCIAVTSSGTLASSVKLYGTSHSTTNALSSSINLTVTLGTGGTFAGGCGSFVADATNPTVYATGTLANFATSATSYATGLGTWTPAGGTVTRVYKFDYSVDSNAPNSTQASSSTITFTWEAQNT